jgi:hypothetical protein
VPVSGVFPAGAIFHLLETGLQVIRLSPCRVDLPARHPIRLGVPAGFLACYFPIWSFDLRSAIRSRDNSSHLCPLNGLYNNAPHGAPTTTGTPSPAVARARRSDPTFATAVRIERDLGSPFASFNARTGHRSSAPKEYREPTPSSQQGPAPVSGVIPAGKRMCLLETELQAIQPLPYRAGPPARRPRRLGTTAGSLCMLLSPSPHGSR